MNSQNFSIKIFEDIGEKFIIASFLMIGEYIILPIEWIDKYKSALPDAMLALFLSTGVLFISVTLAIMKIADAIRVSTTIPKCEKVSQLIDLKFLAKIFASYVIYINQNLKLEIIKHPLFIFNTFACILLYCVFVYDLKLEFIRIHDPLYDTFVSYYFYYLLVNIFLVVLISWSLKRLKNRYHQST
jgi:hypothetical protein